MKTNKEFPTCFDENRKPSLWFTKMLALYLFWVVILHSFFGFSQVNPEGYFPFLSPNNRSIIADFLCWAMWQCSGPIAIIILGKSAREGIELFGVKSFYKKRVLGYGKEIVLILTPLNIALWFGVARLIGFNQVHSDFPFKLNHLWFFWYLLIFNLISIVLMKYASKSKVFLLIEKQVSKFYNLTLWCLTFLFLFYSPMAGFIGNPANHYFIDVRLFFYHAIFFFLGFLTAHTKNYAEITFPKTMTNLFFGILGMLAYAVICAFNFFHVSALALHFFGAAIGSSTLVCLVSFYAGWINLKYPDSFFNLVRRVIGFGYGFNFPIVITLFWITTLLNFPMWISILAINVGFWSIAYLFDKTIRLTKKKLRKAKN